MSSSKRQPLREKYEKMNDDNKNKNDKKYFTTKEPKIDEKEIFFPYISNKINNDTNLQTTKKNKNKKKVQVKDGKLSNEAEILKKELYDLLNKRNFNKNLQNIQRNYLIKKENDKKKQKNKKKSEFKTQYEINVLKRKKHKKEQKKKLKKQKVNFLLNKQEKINVEIENEQFEKLNTDWKNFLALKIAENFPNNSLNTNLLTKKLDDYINNILNLKENKINENIDNIDKILNFDNSKQYYTDEIELKNKEEIESQNDDISNNNINLLIEKRKLNEKKELLKKLNKNEKSYEDNNKEANEFVDKLNEYHNYFENKDFDKIKSSVLKVDEGEEGSIKKLYDPNMHDEIKDRVVNYTLKLFDKFSLYNTLKFWMEKRKEIARILKENPEWNKSNKKEVHTEIKEKVGNNRSVNVKYIYSNPSDEIKKIIPFASKKYIIQKKD
jgi:hypothetical protein